MTCVHLLGLLGICVHLALCVAVSITRSFNVINQHTLLHRHRRDVFDIVLDAGFHTSALQTSMTDEQCYRVRHWQAALHDRQNFMTTSGVYTTDFDQALYI